MKPPVTTVQGGLSNTLRVDYCSVKL